MASAGAAAAAVAAGASVATRPAGAVSVESDRRGAEALQLFPPTARFEDLDARTQALRTPGTLQWVLQDLRQNALYELLLPPLADALASPADTTSHSAADAARSPFLALRRRALFPADRDHAAAAYPVSLAHPEVLVARCAVGAGYTPIGHDSVYTTPRDQRSHRYRSFLTHSYPDDAAAAADADADVATSTRASTVWVLDYTRWTCTATERFFGPLLWPLTPASAAPRDDATMRVLNPTASSTHDATATTAAAATAQRLVVAPTRGAPASGVRVKAAAQARAARAAAPIPNDRLRSAPGTSGAETQSHVLYLQSPYTRNASGQRTALLRVYNRATGVWTNTVALPSVGSSASSSSSSSSAGAGPGAGTRVQVRALCDLPVWSGDEHGPFLPAADEWDALQPGAAVAGPSSAVGVSSGVRAGAGMPAAALRDPRALQLLCAIERGAAAQLPDVVCGLVLSYAWSGAARAFWLCQVVSGLHDSKHSSNSSGSNAQTSLRPQLPLSDPRPMRRRTLDTAVVQFRGPLCVVDPDAVADDPAVVVPFDEATRSAADARVAVTSTGPYGVWHPDLAVRRPWGIINLKAQGLLPYRPADAPAPAAEDVELRWPTLCASPNGAWLAWTVVNPRASATATASAATGAASRSGLMASVSLPALAAAAAEGWTDVASYVCVVHTRLCSPSPVLAAAAPAERGGVFLSPTASAIAQLHVAAAPHPRPPQPRLYYVPVRVPTHAPCAMWFAADSNRLYVLPTRDAAGPQQQQQHERRPLYAVDLHALAAAALRPVPSASATGDSAAMASLWIPNARQVMAASNDPRTHTVTAPVEAVAVPWQCLSRVEPPSSPLPSTTVTASAALAPASGSAETPNPDAPLLRRAAAVGCSQRFTGAFQVPPNPAFDVSAQLHVRVLLPRFTQLVALARSAYFDAQMPLPPHPAPPLSSAIAAAASGSSGRDSKTAVAVAAPGELLAVASIVPSSKPSGGTTKGGAVIGGGGRKETAARAARRAAKSVHVLLVAAAQGLQRHDDPNASAAAAAVARRDDDAKTGAGAGGDGAGAVDDRALMYSCGTRRWCVVSVAHKRVWPVTVAPTGPADADAAAAHVAVDGFDDPAHGLGAAAAVDVTTSAPVQWWDPERRFVRFWRVPPRPLSAHAHA